LKAARARRTKEQAPSLSSTARTCSTLRKRLSATSFRTTILRSSRPLRYRNKISTDGSPVLVGEEKGIDVRIAIDILSCAIRGDCDVALVFSQEQDLSEVADEFRVIAGEQGRWLKIASAFPVSPASHNHRGINSTDWVKIEPAMYDACVDPWDHRKDA